MDDIEELKKLTIEHKESQHLEEALYWKWKFVISKLQIATLNKAKYALQKENMSKDAELAKLRLNLFQRGYQAIKNQEETAQHEYEELKKVLESKIGFPAEDCIIDDETFEVKRISELTKNTNT